MKLERPLISDDWKRNWQQSIAVRISGMVLWVVVPLVFIVAMLLMYDLEQQLQERMDVRGDMLVHRVVTELAAQQPPQLAEIAADMEAQLQETGYNGLILKLNGQTLQLGQPRDGDRIQTRISSLGSHGHGHDNSVDGQDKLTMMAYHRPIAEQARSQRTWILLVLAISLLLFGVFLIWSIRMIVHKPLQALVGATRAVSFGDTSIRLKAEGVDEFSYISRFFNAMMDELEDSQKTLEKTAAEARQASQAKSVFLANMSHELRTPLNAIIGYSEMLQEDLEERQLQQEAADVLRVQDAARHLLEIINNILDVSKIEAGKVDVYLERFPVQALVTEVVGTMQPLVNKRHNEFRVEYDGDVGYMRSDQTKVRQILLNLLSNAAKFTEDGHIRLRIARIEEAGRAMVRFDIFDDGIGISREQMKLLFQAFTQADLSTTRKYGGTGLGLVICKYYCRLLEGSISLDSDLGKGTVFHVLLPAESGRPGER